MEKCIHRTQMLSLQAEVNRGITEQGHNSRIEKVVKSEIKLPFMIPDHETKCETDGLTVVQM